MNKDKVKSYATALAEILEKDLIAAEQKKVALNFIKLLIKNGDLGKAKKILDQAQDILLIKKGKRKITIESARRVTAANKKLLQSVAKEGDIITNKINPDLIAGIKIIINDSKQFDASMQKRLQSIFF